MISEGSCDTMMYDAENSGINYVLKYTEREKQLF